MSYLSKVVEDGFLLRQEVCSFVQEFIRGDVSEIEAAGVLSVLAMKGESASELLGVIDALYSLCQTNYVAPDAIDTCGTGGSGLPKLNISSAAALTCAACGLKIAKHGNRSVTSRAGSADVFFSAGWPQEIEVERIIDCYEKTGFAFLFAPLFYPAMKAFASLRKALGIRTIFNLAGPIANPFRVGKQLVGVADIKFLDVYAELLADMGRDGLIVYADSGLDEIDGFNLTRALLLRGGERRLFVINPEDIIGGINLKKEDLISQGREYNIAVFDDFIEGKATESFSCVVGLNAGYVLWVAGKVDSPKRGFEMAMDAISSRKIRDKWHEILSVIRGEDSDAER